VIAAIGAGLPENQTIVWLNEPLKQDGRETCNEETPAVVEKLAHGSAEDAE
jgi:hypothetical protein